VNYHHQPAQDIQNSGHAPDARESAIIASLRRVTTFAKCGVNTLSCVVRADYNNEMPKTGLVEGMTKVKHFSY
jgi:hypothetical protein